MKRIRTLFQLLNDAKITRKFIAQRSLPLIVKQVTNQKSTSVVIPTIGFISLVHAASKTKSAMSDTNSLEHVLRNSDQLFDENHYQEAYDTLLKYQEQSLPEIKWRLARALYSIAKTADKNEKARMVNEALELVKSALETDDKNFAIHKWLAIIMDAKAEPEGIKARVTQIETVQHHMRKAVELNPEDPTSWYLLGQFEFSLADLSWLQRKVVSAIFATPPDGAYDKALDYFEKAEAIKPGFYTMNWLMLGKCYMALKNSEKAKEFLDKAANCNVLNSDDKKCKEEATQLLKKV